MNFFALQLSRVVKCCALKFEFENSSIDAMCMKKVIYLYKLFPHTEGLNRADLDCLVLSILPLSFVIVVYVVIDIILFCFHRAARNLLEDFVGIYLDGNSSFLQETVDKKCLQFEVNISFMLSICKHEICTLIMWKAICVGYIYIYKLYIYIYIYIGSL